MSKHRERFVALRALLARRHLSVDDDAIRAGRLLVDGRPVLNPAARVPATAAVRVVAQRGLRGDRKLSAALAQLEVPVAGRVAVDVGASSGGFTTALLRHGARRVYAVDAGVGQLVGRLRADPRVVNLEGHNLGAIGPADVPEPVALVTVDLSYLSLARAVPQLERLTIAPGADLVALVKPMFELGLPRPPARATDVDIAGDIAARAIHRSGWAVLGRCPSVIPGRGGAVELFLHARRIDGGRP